MVKPQTSQLVLRLLLAFGLVLGGSSAMVQGRASKAKAKRLFVQGSKAFSEGRYADGLASFRASYSQVERPRTLYNIATCQDRLGQVEAAYVDYKRFEKVAEARDVLYLGRGTGYPIALEGALKLKEISYIHAEGYAAGEMKHGPIALIDEHVPVIVIAPSDDLFDKTASNMQEVIARGGRVIFLADAAGIKKLGDMAAATIELPHVDPFVAPILYTIPVQLLSYHTAVTKGTDVDQPRNLAKSVTVE